MKVSFTRYGGMIGAAVLTVVSAGLAQADGSDEAAAYRPAIAQGYNWTGIYVGGDLGAIRTGDIGGGFVFPAAPGNSFITPGDTRGVAGAHVGAQYQFSNLVVGIEGAVKYSLRGGFASTPGLGNAPPVGCNAATAFTCEARLSYIEQLGGRLGWAKNNWLIYGTGGVARTIIETQARTIATGIPLAMGSSDHKGWFAGGGVEYALSQSVILGAEYTHYKFGTETHDLGANSRFVSADADAITARLTFKLGPAERSYEPLK